MVKKYEAETLTDISTGYITGLPPSAVVLASNYDALESAARRVLDRFYADAVPQEKQFSELIDLCKLLYNAPTQASGEVNGV